MSDLLRLYLDPDEINELDGYPWQWSLGFRVFYQTDAEGLLIEPKRRIPDVVREQAGHRCVRCGHPFIVGKTPGRWSPCDEECKHVGPIRVRYKDGGEDWHPILMTHPSHWLTPGMKNIEAVEAEWRVLTVHHLRGVKHDCRWHNLVSLCQRCHLVIQGKVHMERRWNREHSDWFKPYVAGYYAWSILDQEITREDAMERMHELLALEQTQNSLFDD